MSDATIGDCRLMLGDCLERLKELPTASVDCVVTDPPYGITNESYDREVPADVWRECHRVAREDAALVSFAAGRTYHRIASAIEAAGWTVRQMWGWVYADGMITSAWPKEGFDRLSPAMDPICYATRGKVLLNLVRDGDDEWDKGTRKRGENRLSRRSSTHGLSKAAGHWPRSIIAGADVEGFQFFSLARTNGGHPAERVDHPNAKPLALMDWIVSKLPGAVVLDPFMGSGTTLAAASDLGRKAIGIERDPGYFDTAVRRLTERHDRLRERLFV